MPWSTWRWCRPTDEAVAGGSSLPLYLVKKLLSELERKSVEAFRQADKRPLRVVLDNVRSMHNVGSVFRSADAFLVEGLDLCGYTPCPPHRDIHKTALGATETVTWQSFPDAAERVRVLRAEGYAVWAVEQAHGSLLLHQWEGLQGQRQAVVFGNEVEGIQEEVLQACSGCLEIPQLGMKHSLNISVAAGIVLWELCRPYFSEQI